MGVGILKPILKRWTLAHLGENHVLQIFVVKMRTDVEECMNRLFSEQGCEDLWERRNLKEKLPTLKMI